MKKLLVDKVGFTPVVQGNGKQTYTFRAELTYGAILEEHIYSNGAPRGNFPKYMSMDALRAIDLILPFQGRVAA